MADLPKGTHILSGSESQRLRTFCSSVTFQSSDLDDYARLLQTGPLSKIQKDFQSRIASSSLEAARADLASITYGPSKIPLYNYLLQLIHLNPASRPLYTSIITYLATDAKVPVDTPDLSGTTTLMWCLSTKPYFEPEIADVLLAAGGNINRRNRYGCVAAHDAVMARDFSFEGKKRTCGAVRYFVEHGGDLDVECGDGTTPRGIVERTSGKMIPELGKVVKGAGVLDGSAACEACGLRGGPLLTCGKCGVRRYCDRICQGKEWKIHKKSLLLHSYMSSDCFQLDEERQRRQEADTMSQQQLAGHARKEETLFPLLSLPTELWVKIARLALQDHPTIDVDSFFPPLSQFDTARHTAYRERARLLYQQPSLTRTCRTLRNELLPWIYSTKVEIILPDSKGVWTLEQIGAWLRMIGSANRRCVKGLKMLSPGRSLRGSNQVQDVERAWRGIEYRFYEPERFVAGEEELRRDCNWKYLKFATRVEFL